MSNVLADRFRRWFQYENDVHRSVFASLEGVPTERRESPEFRRAVDIMAHVVAARGIWRRRIQGTSRPQEVRFPQENSAEEVRSAWEESVAEWSALLQTFDDEALARIVEYRMLDGSSNRNSVEEILTQLFGHSFYHRGQVAMLVKSAGGEPAPTDYVLWLRG